MEIREVTIMEVLNFRDEKVEIQRKLHRSNPKAMVVSLGMNIPGPIKSGSSIFRAFCEGQKALKQMICAESGIIIEEKKLEKTAGYAAIYLVDGINKQVLKEKAIFLEEMHPLGRIFDIDVLGENLDVVSRTDVGVSQRKCLICNNDAKVCGRSRAHAVQELQEKVEAIIRNWEENMAI